MGVGLGAIVGVSVGVGVGVSVCVGVGVSVGVGSGVVLGPAQPRGIDVSNVKVIAIVNSFDFFITIIYQG